MKKIIIAASVTSTLLVGLLAVARIVFTSKVGDSMSMTTVSDLKFGNKYLRRLCAISGDKVEMKNGALFVNDKNFDEMLDLIRSYIITLKESYSIANDDVNERYATGNLQMISKDSAIAGFNNSMIKKYSSAIKLNPYLETRFDFGAFAWCGKNGNCTIDNFEPLKIPAHCSFVLGDNRHNAMDFRFIGFVKKENIKGVVFNK